MASEEPIKKQQEPTNALEEEDEFEEFELEGEDAQIRSTLAETLQLDHFCCFNRQRSGGFPLHIWNDNKLHRDNR